VDQRPPLSEQEFNAAAQRVIESAPAGMSEEQFNALVDQEIQKGAQKARFDAIENSPLIQGAMGGGLMSIGPQAIDGTRKVIHNIARRMYTGAAKFPKEITKNVKGGADAMADTAMAEGLNVSRGGYRKAGDVIEGLDDQVQAAVKGSPATVSRRKVYSHLKGPIELFRNQVDNAADLNTIRDKGRKFVQQNPHDIPVEQAQAMKSGTYQAQRKKYGQMGGAEVESEKALAHGLMEEIGKAVPEVLPLNARQSALIPVKNALGAATRRVGNRDTIGLTDVIAAGTNPKLLAGTLAMRALPQSMLARGINRTGKAGPTPEALQAAVRAMLLGLTAEQPEP
jgi:hypothetical protein